MNRHQENFYFSWEAVNVVYSRLLSYNAEWCKRISMNPYQVKLVMFEEIHESARKKKRKNFYRLTIAYFDRPSFCFFYRGNIISHDLMTHRFIICVSPTNNILASHPVEKELFVLMQNSWLIRKQCFAITSITLWIMYAYNCFFKWLLHYINVNWS